MHNQTARQPKTQHLSPGRLSDIVLSPGPHPTRRMGLCALEACAWLAGEEHTNRPASVPPVLARFIGAWDDSMSAQERPRLLQPLLQEAIAADHSETAEARRTALAKDWMVRTATPTWMRAAGLHAQALPLEHLNPITEQQPQTSLHTTILEIALQMVTGRMNRIKESFPEPPDQSPWRTSYVPSYQTAMAAGLHAANTAASTPPNPQDWPHMSQMVRECCRTAAHIIAGLALIQPQPAATHRSHSPDDPLAPHRQQLSASASDLLHRMATLKQPPDAQVTQKTLQARFDRLAAQWINATRFTSSPAMFDDPSYQQIIAMGPRALPLILQALKGHHDHWFVALHHITGYQPVPPDLAGRVPDMARIWLAWGQEQGIIPIPDQQPSKTPI